MTLSSRYYWLAVIFGYTGFNYVFNHFFADNPGVLSAMDMLPPLVSALITFYAVRRKSGAVRFFWLMIAWSAVCYLVAQFIWFYYASILHINAPSLSLADLFWNLQNVLFVVGLCRLIYIHVNWTRSIRLAFDASMTMLALTMLSIEYIIRPAIADRGAEEGLLTLFTNVMYPVSDLVIVICMYGVVTLLPSLFGKHQLKILTAGMLFFVFVDTAYLIMVTRDSYNIGGWIDPLYNTALLTVAYSSLLHGAKDKEEAPSDEDSSPSVGESMRFPGQLVPYLCICIVLGLMLLQESNWNSMKVTGAILIAALLFRQVTVLLDYDRILQKYKSLFIQHEQLAYHDELTKLPNRRYFQSQLTRELKKAEGAKHRLAVLFLDLDRFKYINDSMGHQFGDLLITGVSQRLCSHLGDGQFLARMGGDEFTILVTNMQGKDELHQLAEKLCEAVKLPFFVDSHEVRTATSIGIACYPEDGSDAVELLKKADLALYRAKEAGCSYYVYTPELELHAGRRIGAESALRKALEQKELFLLYQPLFGTDTTELLGVEALLRWKRAEGITVSPAAFLPLAEETGLILPIGEWVLREACTQAVAWKRNGYPLLSMSVNISVKQLMQRDFVEKLEAVLKETGMNPRLLVLDINESYELDVMASAVLQRLKAIGIKIAMDDFGTGFSSLASLQYFKADTLKISQSFIREINDKPDRIDIVKAIQAMANSLRLNVVVEGVETKEAYDLLRDIHIDSCQGYYFSYPVTAEELERRYLSPKVPHVST